MESAYFVSCWQVYDLKNLLMGGYRRVRPIHRGGPAGREQFSAELGAEVAQRILTPSRDSLLRVHRPLSTV